ncbi:MAG: TorF family putative porin [Pseudomonadota bacterium]
MTRYLSLAGAAGLALAAAAAPASAGDLFGRSEGGSVKDGAAPASGGRELTWSVNIGGTTDYVFRGISQNFEDPAVQGGADLSYGLFYLGVWASNVDFVQGSGGPNSGDANIEVDIYAGIKPTLGMLTFDLGVIYYAYPGAHDAPNAELDYVEIKGGVSAAIEKLTIGFTAFYSPEYTAETGDTWTLEGSAAYTLPNVWIFSPSVSALVGTTLFSDNSNLDYAYWNAGIALAVDKFTFDFRYWDTDSNGADFCANAGLCDERFVFTAKVALP